MFTFTITFSIVVSTRIGKVHKMKHSHFSPIKWMPLVIKQKKNQLTVLEGSIHTLFFKEKKNYRRLMSNLLKIVI